MAIAKATHQIYSLIRTSWANLGLSRGYQKQRNAESLSTQPATTLATQTTTGRSRMRNIPRQIYKTDESFIANETADSGTEYEPSSSSESEDNENASQNDNSADDTTVGPSIGGLIAASSFKI